VGALLFGQKDLKSQTQLLSSKFNALNWAIWQAAVWACAKKYSLSSMKSKEVVYSNKELSVIGIVDTNVQKLLDKRNYDVMTANGQRG